MKVLIENGRFKKGIILLYLIQIVAVVFAQGMSLGDDIRISSTSVKVSQGTEMTLTSGLSISSEATFTNDGSVFFQNNDDETLDINTTLDGTGTYYIYGDNDYFLKGAGAAVSSLSINGGNTLWLEDDFAVVNSLYLEDGIINVSDDVEFKIESTESDAINFDDNIGNTSYVVGTLSRNTISGVEYSFPVGVNSVGFHPFTVKDLTDAGYVSVIYQPDFYTTWSGSEESFALEEVGGWKVTTEEDNLSFTPALSLFDNYYNVLDGNYNIFYSADPDAISPEFSLDFNSEIEGDYLTTEESYLAGTFALAEIVTNIEGKDGVPVPDLINFLVKDGGGRTTFEIPGLYNYQTVVLSVYNRFGNLVYRSSSYANDFDSRNYRSGTYFYELTLETNEGKSVLVRNIIEIMDHN